MRDQGIRGTCVAFAVTATHEVARGQNEDLAEEVLYWGCKQVDGDSESGTSLTSASVALSKWGQPDERYWPYDAARGESAPSYAPPPKALLNANCRKARLIQIALTTQDIRVLVADGRAVVLTFPVSRGFLTTTDGWIVVPTPDESFGDMHAVLVVGYAAASATTDGHLIIRNSWGGAWGENGYGYMPDAYIERYGLEGWIVERLT